ncbi:MAG TPA: aminotransferase class I/II-fold pyridoxal phosphate-dependent enzyme [Candidatus Krumholzibacteria bacterium]|nr:aminotransferase class I/II-fold pyridoxal phosphate-dependent enzyme [Candidatus Krumholzibacteria bacterium]
MTPWPAQSSGSDYLTWTKRRVPVRYNLARSGVPRLALERLELTLSDLLHNQNAEDGWPPLMERIAARQELTPAHVVTTHGCSMANHLAMAAILEAGDDVVMETPVYEPLVRVAEYLGARVIWFARHAENRWHIDPEEVRRALTPKTKLVVVSNLHNPTGAFDNQDTLSDVARAAESVGARVLVDEVYLEFFHARGARSAVGQSPRILATSSMTKVFGLDGLRLGWVLAEPELAERMRRLNDLFSVNTAHPSERIAARALEHADALLAESNALLARNIELVDAFVRSHDDLSWAKPRAGTVGFVQVADRDVDRLVDRLHAEFEVAVVPGRFFGAPDHFRISFGLESDLMREALSRIGRVLRERG